MAKNSEELALQALTPLLVDPTPRVLHGAKAQAGIFPGAGQKDKAAARLCLEQRWLEPTGQFAGKGRSQKELHRITFDGIQAVLSRSEAPQLLRGLQDSLALLNARVSDLTQTIRDTLAEIARDVEPLQRGVAPLQQAILQLEEKLRPPDVEQILRRLKDTAPGATVPSAGADWMEEVVQMAAEQRHRNAFQRLSLPDIYERLRGRHPDLTLEQFHSGLCRLHEAQRIRLGPYTQALASLPDPRNALYLDREVKFYVEPA